MGKTFIAFGTMMAVIFGGGFLIRLVRDSDFYIAEFIGAIVGIFLIVIGVFAQRKIRLDNHSL